MIFYTLHELFNVFDVNTENDKTDHGKRNCKLFLLGTFIWIIVFILAWNFKLGFFGPRKIWTDSVIYGLWVLLFADLFVMAYIYRSYFGRNILWETHGEDTDELFDYDEKKHRYIKKVKQQTPVIQQNHQRIPGFLFQPQSASNINTVSQKEQSSKEVNEQNNVDNLKNDSE